MKTTFLSLAFTVLSTCSLFAHNMWIETTTTGKQGKSQSVKVFLGGYGENERDSTKNWFSNTKEFTIWLIEPNGTKKQLTTKAEAIYFESSFTPDKEGVYTLSIGHEVAEVYGTTRYYYVATAQVKVGASTLGQTNLSAATDLCIQTSKVPTTPKPATLKFTYKGKDLDKTRASVGSPAGWAKAFETSNGTITFDALWSGLYIAEAFYTEDQAGSLNGKDYKKTMFVGTYGFEVEK